MDAYPPRPIRDELSQAWAVDLRVGAARWVTRLKDNAPLAPLTEAAMRGLFLYGAVRGHSRRNSPIDVALSPAMDMTTVIGGIAALCTTVGYAPQLKKCWQTGQADDLSILTFSVLALGVALWVIYGVMKSDTVIIAANAVSLAFLCGILFYKLREHRPRS